MRLKWRIRTRNRQRVVGDRRLIIEEDNFRGGKGCKGKIVQWLVMAGVLYAYLLPVTSPFCKYKTSMFRQTFYINNFLLYVQLNQKNDVLKMCSNFNQMHILEYTKDTPILPTCLSGCGQRAESILGCWEDGPLRSGRLER